MKTSRIQRSQPQRKRKESTLLERLVYERYVDGVDKEGEFAHGQLKAISDYAMKISDLLQPDDQLESWIQAKLAVMKSDIDEIFHSLDAKALKLGGAAAGTGLMAPDSGSVELPDDIDVFMGGSEDGEEGGDLKSFDEFSEGDEDLVDVGDEDESEEEDDEEIESEDKK